MLKTILHIVCTFLLLDIAFCTLAYAINTDTTSYKSIFLNNKNMDIRKNHFSIIPTLGAGYDFDDYNNSVTLNFEIEAIYNITNKVSLGIGTSISKINLESGYNYDKNFNLKDNLDSFIVPIFFTFQYNWKLKNNQYISPFTRIGIANSSQDYGSTYIEEIENSTSISYIEHDIAIETDTYLALGIDWILRNNIVLTIVLESISIDRELSEKQNSANKEVSSVTEEDDRHWNNAINLKIGYIIQ